MNKETIDAMKQEISNIEYELKGERGLCGSYDVPLSALHKYIDEIEREEAQQVAVPQAEMNPLWLATHPDKLGPPQAERVPMTQSEIDDLPSCGVNDGSQAWLRGFLRLVEAHHGIGVKP